VEQAYCPAVLDWRAREQDASRAERRLHDIELLPLENVQMRFGR
jgi:hypothetical protein